VARTIALVVLVLCLAGGTATAGVEDVTFGGRFMWDAGAWSNVDSDLEEYFGAFENGTETRTARVEATGFIYPRMAFCLSWDFASGDEYSLKHSYLEARDVPFVGNLRAGYFYEPVGLQSQMSSKYYTFLEPALPTALAPWRNAGLMAHRQFMEGRGVWQAGFFLTTDSMAAKSGDDDYSLTGRVAFLPVGEPGDDLLVHVGVSGSYQKPEDSVRLRSRPENHMSDYLIDTGDMSNVDHVIRLGAEVAAVYGPFHCAAEFLNANVSSCDDDMMEPDRIALEDDASFSGIYLQAGYFVTGETRSFLKGNWARTSPKSVLLEDGLGAIELAIRYSSLDLNDEGAGIYGGQMSDVTLGVNWYFHPNARMMCNYVLATVKDEDDEEIGGADAFVTRLQFDF
jgi:phosphate-selective porin OprO/OprP